MIPARLRLAAAVAGALALGAPPVSAGVEYVLGYGLEYSDNINLAPMDEKSEVIHVIGGSIVIEDLGPKLETQLGARAEYRYYQKDVFDDQAFANVEARANWKIFPERFHWMVQDIYAPTINPQEKLTPDNIKDVNVLTTGPDAFLRFSDAHTLNLGARYTDFYFEDSGRDSERMSGYGRWLYKATPQTTLSLNVEDESIKFEDPAGGDDIDRRDAFLGVENRAARNVFVLNLGKTRIERESGDETDGTLARFSWNREITSERTFNLTASRELSDTGRDAVASVTPGPGPSVIGSFDSEDVFVTKRVNMTYSRRRGVGADSVQLYASRKEFEQDLQNDEKEQGLRLDVGYGFSANLLGGFGTAYTVSEFLAIERLDRKRVVNLGLAYRATRTVSAGVELRLTRSTSTNADFDYDEGRLMLSLRYSERVTR